MLNKDITIKIKQDELELLGQVINSGLEALTLEDRRNREKILVMSILKSLSIKFAKKLCERKDKYSLKLNLPEAQALVIAYQKDYIEADYKNNWASMLLMRRMNELDQLTV